MQRVIADHGSFVARRWRCERLLCMLVAASFLLGGVSPAALSVGGIRASEAPAEEEQKESQEESAEGKECLARPRRPRWRQSLEPVVFITAAVFSDHWSRCPPRHILRVGHRLSDELLAPLTI